MITRRLTALSLLLLFSAPGLLSAQSAEDAARFERLLVDGRAHMDAQRYEEARHAFLAAEEIFQHPALSLRIAQAEVSSGRCTSAAARHGALRDAGNLPPENAAELDALADDLRRCVPLGRLHVSCSPGDARLSLDDASHDVGAPACGEETTLPAGAYTLTASHPDMAPRTESIEIREDQRTELTLSLSPAEITPPPSPMAWRGPVGWAALGTGAALLTAGLAVDAGAPARQEEIRLAAEAGDFRRVQNLEQEATRRRLHSGILLGTGIGVAAGGGLILWQHSRRDTSLALTPSLDGLRVEILFP